MSDLELKSYLRHAAFVRRSALSDEARAAAAEAMSLSEFPVAIPHGAVVAGYMPIRHEIDPRPLLRVLRARGARTAMPTIAAQDAPLIFRAWADGDPLQRGPLGISEPLGDAEILVPDIVLVPLAAFDRSGHRIGYGGGYYDRTLTRLRRSTSIVAVGLAFACQHTDRIPATEHDARLDLVLTDIEVIDCRGS